MRTELCKFLERDLGYQVLALDQSEQSLEERAEQLDGIARFVEQQVGMLVMVIGALDEHIPRARAGSVSTALFLAARAKGIPIRVLVSKRFFGHASIGRPYPTEIEEERRAHEHLVSLLHEAFHAPWATISPYEDLASIRDGIRAFHNRAAREGLESIHRRILEPSAMNRLYGRAAYGAFEGFFASEHRAFLCILRESLGRQRAAYELWTAGVNRGRADREIESPLAQLEFVKQAAVELVEETRRTVNATLRESVSEGDPSRMNALAEVLAGTLASAISWRMELSGVRFPSQHSKSAAAVDTGLDEMGRMILELPERLEAQLEEAVEKAKAMSERLHVTRDIPERWEQFVSDELTRAGEAFAG